MPAAKNLKLRAERQLINDIFDRAQPAQCVREDEAIVRPENFKPRFLQQRSRLERREQDCVLVERATGYYIARGGIPGVVLPKRKQAARFERFTDDCGRV